MPAPHKLTPVERNELLRRLLAGQLPDERGYFGPFGGCFAPEILMPVLGRLQVRVRETLGSERFRGEMKDVLGNRAGRPTPLTRAPGLSKRWGAEVWLKREDRVWTGSCAINNALGQALLARRAGARRVVAATGSGRHGLAVAVASRHLGLQSTIYIGAADSARRPAIARHLRAAGADVVELDSRDSTLCAAIDEAFRDWVTDPEGSHYLAGSIVGPHPYPYLIRELQKVIGEEARAQMLQATGRLPDAAFAAIGEDTGASGLFQAFVGDAQTQLVGVEAGGSGPQAGGHAAALCLGTPGIMHGCLTRWLQDADGQMLPTRSVAAGMNYPGAGPELVMLQAIGRLDCTMVTDDEARDALEECARIEDIRVGFAAAHALAGARRWIATREARRLLICIAGCDDEKMTFPPSAAPDRPGNRSSA